ncbi:MAG TPA: energy transducer TonB, partial [Prolixibacteraceae bacterium]
GEMSVKYDTASTDHLVISEFRKDGFLKTKTQLLFKGKKFNLDNLDEHINKGELLADGIQTDYREDETVASELLYKEEKLQKQTFFYPNGKMQMAFSGDEKTLNGEYRMWHPNGQLSFSGTYLNNLKNGEFQLFDQSGILVRKGIYRYGTLVSGNAVVQDLVYENPDKLAYYIGGDQAFNEFLKLKSANFDLLKVLGDDVFRNASLRLTISKTGNISNVEIRSLENSSDNQIINFVFANFPVFNPATIEDVPVTSKLNLNLILTKEGWQKKLKTKADPALQNEDSLDDAPYSYVEEMPEFTGGEMALRSFLANTVKYPVEAMEKGIQGKVFVSYIIEKDGSITNVKIQRGVHPSLDAESI